MPQKGKIRELQERLRISMQTVKGLSEYCDKYKKRIKELESKLKDHGDIGDVSDSLVAFADWRDKNEDWINANCETNNDVVTAYERQRLAMHRDF